MINSKANPSRIIRWETLNGLPGEGPIPKHFHMGHPTPWTQGLVVRFWNADGTDWVGNFQGRQDWSTNVLLWPEADSVAIIAMDNFYLVDAQNPENYLTLVSSPLGDCALLAESQKLLFVAASTAVHAIGQDRVLLWSQNDLDGYDVQLIDCANGVVTVDVEEYLGGARRTRRLSSQDGRIL